MAVDFERFDQAHWSEAERERVQVIFEFVQMLIFDKDFERVSARFSDSPYVQHNRLVGSGIQPLVDFTRRLLKLLPDFVTEMKHVHVDGEYVVVRSHATARSKHRGNDRKGAIIVDTWRVVDGRIVEHWDAVQPLDLGMRLGLLAGGGSVRNSNGVF